MSVREAVPVREVVVAREPVLSWARGFRLRQALKGSLWFVPLLGGVLGVLLAQVDAWRRPGVPASWQFSADTASGVLTVIISAMVGLFGFVVTIGVLVVQMATGTLSPRFMRLWYRDRLQKLVLAFFVGTIAFAFSLLRRVSEDAVPSIGVYVAGVAFGLSLLLLLLYLNRFAHSLRPVGVGTLVARQGREELRKATETRLRVTRSANPVRGRSPVALVGVPRSGAIQAINVRRLLAEAVRADCVLALHCSIGDFVRPGEAVVGVYSDGGTPNTAAIAGAVALGDERSIEDDPAFAMRILVDIAIRALSPAVNDPTTAVQMINHIEVLLYELAPYLDGTDHVVVADERGTVRVVAPTRTFADYLGLAMTEIREYGGGAVQVCRRLTSVLHSLLPVVPPGCRPVVEAELAALGRTIAARFPDAETRAFAGRDDRQGIGGPHAA
ncbi:DUF2254 domain-containing protein [Phytohabitans rumicis]|uniref:DUF2254 domain-containing protein n=1 Tax=Phytohabitans rumicis TaxID=1076125 RepID=UPI001C49C0DE|nr:DUF2254 domain-containing protein [Phytohabitans rumicis]